MACILLNEIASLFFLPSFGKYLESAEPRLSASVPDVRKKAEQRGLEKEEEDYFNKDRFVIVSLLVIDFFSLFCSTVFFYQLQYRLVMHLIRYSRVLLCSEVIL